MGEARRLARADSEGGEPILVVVERAEVERATSPILFQSSAVFQAGFW
jgi:hypothetical protein